MPQPYQPTAEDFERWAGHIAECAGTDLCFFRRKQASIKEEVAAYLRAQAAAARERESRLPALEDAARRVIEAFEMSGGNAYGVDIRRLQRALAGSGSTPAATDPRLSELRQPGGAQGAEYPVFGHREELLVMLRVYGINRFAVVSVNALSPEVQILVAHGPCEGVLWHDVLWYIPAAALVPPQAPKSEVQS